MDWISAVCKLLVVLWWILVTVEVRCSSGAVSRWVKPLRPLIVASEGRPALSRCAVEARDNRARREKSIFDKNAVEVDIYSTIDLETHPFAEYFVEFFGYPMKNINTAEIAVKAEQM